MSELMNAQRGRREFRWQLLASVSALTLLAAICVSQESEAADQDADRPTVWIELGGQLERLSKSDDAFTPSFVANIPSTFFSPLDFQKPLQYSFGGQGSVSFQPEGSDWTFSAAVRYGRSNGTRERHQQTPNGLLHVHSNIPFPAPIPTLYPSANKPGKYAINQGYAVYFNGHVKFEDAKSKQSETHTVLDFQVGKDVGLGLFGRGGESTLSAGLRIAQFTSAANISFQVEPDVNYPTAPVTTFAQKYTLHHFHTQFHDYAATLNAQRSFRGVGPSVAWSGSVPFAGNSDRGEMALDWGASAAVLFGRQKVRGHHQTTARLYSGTGTKVLGEGVGETNAAVHHRRVVAFASSGGIAHYSQQGADFNRSRTVIVPNLGGFAGVSFRYSDAKISLGYRADFFFGAMDEGIDTRQTQNVGFHGPFTTISIGLGG